MVLERYQHSPKKRLMMLYMLLASVLFAVDQWTKRMALSELYYGESVEVTSFFNFTLVFNPGSAFGLFANFGGTQRWILAALVFIICIVLIVWIYRVIETKRLEAIGMTLLLGGALGNLWDRVYYGVVVDFLDFYVAQWHWPAFNLADTFISIGVFLLIIDIFKSPK